MSSLLIYNASLLSFQDGFPQNCDSMLIEGDRIKAIGRYETLQSRIESGTVLLDAKGKTVMPGFNDTHIHIWKAGNLKTFMLDLRSVESLEEMLSLLSDYNRRFPEVQWITARGFNEATWTNSAFPTKYDLDKVSKEKPIYVIRTCAHIAVANSKAMDLSFINTETKIPEGGEIRLGADGRPNGIFTETALGLITRHIPAYTKGELKTMVRAAREEMFRFGITAVTDPAVDPFLLETYYEMNRDNELGFRLHAIPILLPDGSDQPYHVPEYFSSPFFTVNAVKFFSDGGLSGKTAALKRPYKNSDDHGVLRLKKDQYLSLCLASMEKGLGIATHAIGDAAIDFVIEVYKEIHHSFPEGKKRIEHLGLPVTGNLADMAKYQIAASMQTIFIHELGRNFINYLDEEYLDHCYPVKSVLKHGILTALSSDAPVVRNFNPLKGVETAVTRISRDGNSIAPQEAITVSEALKAYTADAARISSIDDIGILAAGRLADFIVLDRNPLTTAPDQLAEIKVEKTYVGGEKVWELK
jgi:predicted amidohydrolase YtcJ